MHESTIRPVFPPREDVEVGDVYVAHDHPGLEIPAVPRRFLPADARVSRLVIPRGAAGTRGRVGVPELKLAIAGSAMVDVVPMEALALVLGARWTEEHEVMLRVPEVETREAAVAQVLSAAANDEGRLVPSLVTEILAWLCDAGVAWGRDTSPPLQLSVLCEVFHTRAIEIAIPTGRVPRAAPPEQPARAREAAAVARDLNAKLSKVGIEVPSGGSFRFVSASPQGVVMRRVFSCPVAVGYRSVELRVDPARGVLLHSGAAGPAPALVRGDLAWGLAVAIENWLARTYPEARYGLRLIPDSDPPRYEYDSLGREPDPPPDLELEVRRHAVEIAGGAPDARVLAAIVIERRPD